MKDFDNDEVPLKPLDPFSEDNPDGIKRIRNDKLFIEKKWNGSAFVQCDITDSFKESGPGIKIEYTLDKDELYYYACEFCKNGYKRRKHWLSFFSALFVISFFVLGIIFFLTLQYRYILFSFSSVGALAVLWRIPEIFIENMAKKSADASPDYVEVYIDNIVVCRNGVESKIKLGTDVYYMGLENLFLVFPIGREVLIIPKRAVDPDLLPEVEAILTSGARPYPYEWR